MPRKGGTSGKGPGPVLHGWCPDNTNLGVRGDRAVPGDPLAWAGREASSKPELWAWLQTLISRLVTCCRGQVTERL